MWSGNVDVLVGYLVVLWVEQFGQLVEDEPRVVDGASEDVVHRRVQVMGCKNSVRRSKPRPHHQHGVRWLVELSAGDGGLQLPEGVADMGQRLALDSQSGWDVVGARRQNHVMSQQRERNLVGNSGTIWQEVERGHRKWRVNMRLFITLMSMENNVIIFLKQFD